MSAVQWVCVAVVAVATVLGVGLFVRGATTIARTVAVGRPASRDRLRPVGRRLRTLAREVLGHERFQHRPVVRHAHWVVMVSFPVLAVTLATGYVQVLDPSATLPVIGHLIPLEWAVELLAWTSLLGIVALIVLRLRIRPRASQPLDEQRRSRFFGSTHWQAYYVEATVLVVVLAVIGLRGLEHALATHEGDAVASAWHFR